MPDDYAEKKAARIERYEAAAERARDHRDALHKHISAATGAMNGTPILIDHHSEGRHREALAKLDRQTHAVCQLNEKAEYYNHKAEAGENNLAISSDDPEAIQKLRAQIADKEKRQAAMKAANRIIKSKPKNQQTPEKITRLVDDVGLSHETAAKLFEPDFCGRAGFPGYSLQNNNSNIKRMKDRITALTNNAQATSTTEDRAHFAVVENTELNRLQLMFQGKPPDDIRKILRQAGFVFSYKNTAWQRHLNNAGREAASRVERQINNLSVEPHWDD